MAQSRCRSLRTLNCDSQCERELEIFNVAHACRSVLEHQHLQGEVIQSNDLLVPAHLAHSVVMILSGAVLDVAPYTAQCTELRPEALQLINHGAAAARIEELHLTVAVMVLANIACVAD